MVSTDEGFMSAAIDQAHAAIAHGDVPIGAVVVRDRTILSTGYNGSIRGMPHCDEVGHLMENGHCVATVHAEANAILQAAKKRDIEVRDIDLFEINEAAQLVANSAAPDANIIFGSVVDDAMGDAVRVTVIAAGFERWDNAQSKGARTSPSGAPLPEPIDLFGGEPDAAEDFSFDLDDDGDDDIPSFLR